MASWVFQDMLAAWNLFDDWTNIAQAVLDALCLPLKSKWEWSIGKTIKDHALGAISVIDS